MVLNNQPWTRLGILRDITGDATWREIDGPASRCGQDYWYRSRDGVEAYINEDQGHLTVEVNGTVRFSGFADDYAHENRSG